MIQMFEFRLTRIEIYNDPNCSGHNNVNARQGHYIRAESEEEARAQMAKWIPNETFTCQKWDSSNGLEIKPAQD